MKSERIDVTIFHATLEQVRANGLGARLRRYHSGFIGEYEVTPVSIDALTLGGELCGGLRGVVAFGWLITELLWVAPAKRNSGIGSALYGSAEAFALDRGVRNAWLTTSAWHDIRFLQVKGYTEFASIENYAHGVPLRFLRKSLTHHGSAPAVFPADIVLQPGSDHNVRVLYEHERTLETRSCGTFPMYPLRLAAMDAHGRVVGGLSADLSVGWLKINVVIVDEDVRNRGVGSLLLDSAEKFAADAGVSEFLCVKRGNESVTSLSLWAPARAPQAPPVEACTHGSTTFTWRHFAPAA